MSIRHLIIVLGDQLTLDSLALSEADKQHDLVWMAEVKHESLKVPSHKTRTALFLSAMRHFKVLLESQGFRVAYQSIHDNTPGCDTFSKLLEKILKDVQPEKVILVHPGEYSVLEEIERACHQAQQVLDVLEDTHFLCTNDEFKAHAKGRKQLRMEYFYRELRKKYGILMDGTQPKGDQWNFDAENRKAFPKKGPIAIPEPMRFKPDALTETAIADVATLFKDNPGELTHFDWPVTREEALLALDDFITHRLEYFGDFQDAMWYSTASLYPSSVYLYHSRLSAALNLKLLNPLEVIRAAEDAYEQGKISIHSAEGFIRQILGWREYVRGIYWLNMPQYLELNAMHADAELPHFYWTAQTKMTCLQSTLQQTLEYGYAHHIQRLMVTGLFALLYGVHPKAIHQWYLAIYVDAVEWVELPNTLGMSQYGDGGLMASKPYIATGKYINRMSNYCQHCAFNPDERTGDDACPFTTLYWQYLLKHEAVLKGNPRMGLQVKNLSKLQPDEIAHLQHRETWIRETLCGTI